MGEEVEVPVDLVVEASDHELLVLYVGEWGGSLLFDAVDEVEIIEERHPKPIPYDVFTLPLKSPILVNVKVKSIQKQICAILF